ncbi:Holliday junction branch migration protein RuvA [Microscilla marina]|uniref:Holliday junction branch migration complex subunit RuvA n=1 Tax=Microscilla marina ATCC 23134 TaxID=313606 RepID=A1ZDY8_MICM2|nr:Holliday junction branch migration protein RuvA [Microscilla marina]EAY31296.1 holliday junction DNA helicase RuvA [Microscilla marina ATCC 23134]
MFAYISGKLAHKEPTFAVIDVHGVGYQINISLNTYTALPISGDCKLHTWLQVREDAQNLYGFTELAEKKLFLLLISVSGIGANTALVMLSSMSVSEIQTAIASEDVKAIKSIKGIGLKTAQRVILELKDKVQKEVGSIAVTPATQQSAVKDEAVMALITLGYAKNVAEKNVAKIFKTKGNDVKVEDVIKEALKM